MDVGSLNQKDITCNSCGKQGRKKVDCWMPGGGAHKGTQSPKGKGKGDSKGGKGKSKGREKTKGK
eukprot:7640879-Pyramimonas_sp.AAC.1